MNNFTKYIKLVLVLLVALTPFMGWAQPVSREVAMAKAESFFSLPSSIRKSITKEPKLSLAIDRSELYVINDEANGGYVVVSGDERMPEILGFSADGRVDAENMPCNMRAWLEEYAAQVNYLREHPDAIVFPQGATEREEVPPLLDCAFNQTAPYNDMCPINTSNGNRCVTGCVATAMAQIMYCHKWPKKTADIIPGYTTQALQVDVPGFDITFIDWDNILNRYDKYSSYTDVQANAVATLMLMCGVSVQMNYYDMSGAWSSDASNAFYQYFAYDDHYEHRSDYSDEDWEQFLYDDLKNGLPIYYSGNSPDGGHAFVVDGYGYEGMPYFHINWGWGGYENNYYLMTNVGGFNNNQAAIMGLKPMDPDGEKIYAVKDNKKITFYYDDQKDNRDGEVIINLRSCNKHEDITECVFDPSFSKLKFRSLRYFFSGCEKLTKIEGIENLNTSDVLCTKAMFGDCTGLKTLDLSKFRTSKVADMTYMFYGCSSLTSLDLSNFNTSNVKFIWAMFEECQNLQTIYASEKWKTDKVEDGGMYMFFNCYMLQGEKGTRFNPSNTTVEYAHIDGGAENPGYFTYKECDAITTIAADAIPADIYSLDGVKVRTAMQGIEGLPPGIYISNGKKLIIK